MNLNQPQDDDLDLGGIEGVKKRLASELVEQKVAALSEAFNYGQAGLDLVIEVLKDDSSPIQSVAYLLLKERAEQQVKEALQEYYREKIKSYYGEKIKYYEFCQKFIVNASHELRTPLNGIIGFLKLILDGMADDPQEEREFLKEAHRSALHLHKKLYDILDIAKMETDKMNLELCEVKLDELFKDVENFKRILAEKKNLSLSLEMPTNHNEIILYGNYQRLLQVVLNLVDNAIKFTSEGGIKISAEVIEKKVGVESQELLNMVKIEVADTGRGVSLKDSNKLFKTLFFQRQCNAQEIGLGLVLSRSFVEKMGGEINFYSPGEGKGSTVTFTIPMLPMYFSPEWHSNS